MEQLRILNNIKIIKEIDEVALKGNLICECSCKKFYIYHTGKQTKGNLAPDIIKVNKKIIIIAKCTHCGETITVLDTGIDGIDTTDSVLMDLKQFILKESIKKFKIFVYYNYLKPNYKSNYFLDLFIDVECDELKKIKRIFE